MAEERGDYIAGRRWKMTEQGREGGREGVGGGGGGGVITEQRDDARAGGGC